MAERTSVQLRPRDRVRLLITASPNARAVAFDRGTPPDRRLVLAYTDSGGALRVRRYDDALPEAVSGVSIVETEGVTSLVLRALRDASWHLVYAKGGTVYLRESENGGRAWSVATTVGAGDACAYDVDEDAKLFACAVYDEDADTWAVRCAVLGSGGALGAFSAAATIVTNAREGADLRHRGDGVWEFAYASLGGTVSILTCRDLSGTGTGTWS
jgi:hypothetical protein